MVKSLYRTVSMKNIQQPSLNYPEAGPAACAFGQKSQVTETTPNPDPQPGLLAKNHK